MKRYIHAAQELPDGYLTTTIFNCRSIKTDDQRNALEALEIAISQKFNQFDKMNEITSHLTSDTHWEGKITEYGNGYYIQLEGTRSSFVAFVSANRVIRKPRNAGDVIRYYEVEGREGQVEKMSQAKY